jgi:hypothetical protein
MDELLGIIRCDRCGQRLEGEIECPVCSGYYDDDVKRNGGMPLWIFIVAAFLTSPLSIPFIIRSTRLSAEQKTLCASGALGWALLGLSFLF